MNNRLAKFNFNTHDLLKMAALLFMFIDHSGLYIFDNNIYLRLIGRLSFPILAVIYGYHFKNRYNIELLFYGLPIVFIEYLLYDKIFFNILYSFFIGGVLLTFYNKKIIQNKNSYIFLFILFIFNFVFYSFLEYGLFVFFFMLSANTKNNVLKIKYFVLTFLFYYILQASALNFSSFYKFLFLILLCLEMFLLYNYKNYDIKMKNKFLELSIKIIARYSLEIYVIQAIIFKIYYYLK